MATLDVTDVNVEPGTLPEKMAAWVIREEREGEPRDAFQIEEIEVPEPGAFEVIVRVMAAGVNYNNVWAALGQPVGVWRYGDHQRNMNRYAHMGCLGVIAASDEQGHSVMRKRNAINGAEIDFTPTSAELDRLLAGLRHAGEILFEAGAERVMPATWDYREFHSEKDLDELRVGRWIRDASDISVNTAHPQGGNPMAADPASGVVDENCRVHGHDNLWVCDASVFPTAVRVNPQLTVMAVSHYAATQIA